MMGYIWIGLGGAFGSMARAWLAITVARATGPQFPWGTILINIIGSFVIGFFGTLTANDSRFAVPGDFRAFVMVGICGGFTTFSSFSLQTLELMRDGRVAQGLGNVGLSVAFCLLSVAAGHYSAGSIHRWHAAAAARSANGMGEVVVAVLNRPREAATLLEAGTRLLEIGGGGHLKALAIRMPPAAAILPSEEVLTASREAAIQAEQEDWVGQLRIAVDAWASAAKPRGVQTSWLDVQGDAADVVIDHGNRADTIVVARPDAHESEQMHDCLHAALFDTQCPVLVVPPGFHGTLGNVVAIAWKDDGLAAKAVHDILPVLRHAGEVHVLSAGATDMPPLFTEMGIEARFHRLREGGGSVGQRLLAAAHQLNADMIVMGAFAHGEWRERIFGGVTRTMLAEADLPLLMRH